MTVNYDTQDHLRLWNLSLNYKKQGKSLFHENLESFLKLNQYESVLQDHIFWEKEEKFLLLLKNYSSDSLPFEEFESNYSALWSSTIKESEAFATNLKIVKNFHPNLESSDYCSWITAIYRKIEIYEDEGCTEQELKNYIQYSLYIFFKDFSD